MRRRLCALTGMPQQPRSARSAVQQLPLHPKNRQTQSWRSLVDALSSQALTATAAAETGRARSDRLTGAQMSSGSRPVSTARMHPAVGGRPDAAEIGPAPVGARRTSGRAAASARIQAHAPPTARSVAAAATAAETAVTDAGAGTTAGIGRCAAAAALTPATCITAQIPGDRARRQLRVWPTCS